MKLDGIGALVTGGASGLGAATAAALVERGARVAIADLDGDRAEKRAVELGDAAVAQQCDVTSESDVERAVAAAVEALGGIRLAVSCAGIGWAERVVGRNGPAQLQPFETVVRVNLIGTFNVVRYSAAAMGDNDPDEGGERGAIVMTASIAAYDGQIGQSAYAASKGGVVVLTLPARVTWRDRGAGLHDRPGHLRHAAPGRASRERAGRWPSRSPIPHALGRRRSTRQLACTSPRTRC